MATKLNQEQISFLQKKGLSLQTIMAYQDGRLSPSTSAAKQIQTYLGGSNPRNPFERTTPALPTPGFPSSLPRIGEPGTRVGPYIPPVYKGPTTTPSTPGSPGTRIPPYIPPANKNPQNDPGPQAPQFPDAPPFPGAPSYPDIKLPEFVDRSAELFGKAKDQYSAAYAPLYQSLELGKQNATANQQRSDQVISGLYSGLANDFKTSGQQQAQQYQDSGAQSQAVAQALQNKIGQIYSGGDQQTNDFAASLGQAPAGQEAVAQGNGERQFQQAEAATSGANQQNFYNQGAANAQNYNTQMAGAANTEGASRRSDLVQQLNNVLSQYDQQGLGYKSEEAQGAIQQGNVLTQRDADQQQQRINNILQVTGIQDSRTAAAASAAIAAWEAQYGAQKDKFGAEQQQYEIGVQQRQAQIDAYNKKIADEHDNAVKGAQQEIENKLAQQKINVDATSAGVPIDPQTGSPVFGNTGTGTPGAFPGSASGKYPDAPVLTQVASTADLADPGRGDQYVTLYTKMVQGVDPNIYNNSTFGEEAAKQAAAVGLNPDVARNNAQLFWNKYMNRG